MNAVMQLTYRVCAGVLVRHCNSNALRLSHVSIAHNLLVFHSRVVFWCWQQDDRLDRCCQWARPLWKEHSVISARFGCISEHSAF
jgi:hypothetical protein